MITCAKWPKAKAKKPVYSKAVFRKEGEINTFSGTEFAARRLTLEETLQKVPQAKSSHGHSNIQKP